MLHLMKLQPSFSETGVCLRESLPTAKHAYETEKLAASQVCPGALPHVRERFLINQCGCPQVEDLMEKPRSLLGKIDLQKRSGAPRDMAAILTEIHVVKCIVLREEWVLWSHCGRRNALLTTRCLDRLLLAIGNMASSADRMYVQINTLKCDIFRLMPEYFASRLDFFVCVHTEEVIDDTDLDKVKRNSD
jgi:hypothetical protein